MKDPIRYTSFNLYRTESRLASGLRLANAASCDTLGKEDASQFPTHEGNSTCGRIRSMNRRCELGNRRLTEYSP
jgi:hypothetical protein